MARLKNKGYFASIQGPFKNFGEKYGGKFLIFFSRLLPEPNFESSLNPSFIQGMSSSPSKLVSLVGMYVDQQSNFCSKLSSNLGTNLDRRLKEKGVFTNTYTEAVTKLIEVMNLHILSNTYIYFHKQAKWQSGLEKPIRFKFFDAFLRARSGDLHGKKCQLSIRVSVMLKTLPSVCKL